MKARLFCKTGQLAGEEFLLGREATIGSRSGNEIVLYPKVISGQHARIYFDNDRKSYFLEDLNSRNGTKLDGMKVMRKEKLDKLHVITFARIFEFIFQVLDDSLVFEEVEPAASDAQVDKTRFDQGPVQLPETFENETGQTKREEVDAKTRFDDAILTPPDIPAERDAGTEEVSVEDPHKTTIGDEFLPTPEILESEKTELDSSPDRESEKTTFDADFVAAPDLDTEKTEDTAQDPKPPQFHLEFTSLDDGPKSFELSEGEHVIGRSSKCEICIDDPSVSREHAKVIVLSNTVKIKDLDSKNHTFLDDKEMEAEFEAPPDAVVKFGKVEARVSQKNS